MEQQFQAQDFWDLRDHLLPLPPQAEGYVRVLFLGTTGAGKTTLVRQFLGTHPTNERFPSTSTGKTTTADCEIILVPGPFKAVITFLSQQHISTYIEECLLAAFLASYEGKTRNEVARKLLTHEEQRFRLRYILGEFPVKEKNMQEPQNAEADTYRVTSQEAQRFASTIQHYLDTIHALVKSVREDSKPELDCFGEQASDEVREVYFQEHVEHELRQQPAFHTLVSDILMAIRQRFTLLSKGELLLAPDGWPQSWSFETLNRREFITTINVFSSNKASFFGKLLTPLVQGIRASGPFRPTWRSGSFPRLVLIDVEGLGHTTETMTSLSTRVTGLFEQVDVIVLVDNVSLPLQAASSTVLETVVTSGHASKLLIGFTHFEIVDGDDLPDRSAREDHVQNSLDNVLLGIGKRVSQQDRLLLKKQLEGRVFFLSYLQEQLTSELQDAPENAERAETREELRRMLATIEATELPLPSEEVRPVYSERSLFVSLQKAVKTFRDHWRGRLGLMVVSNIKKEHWKRIEALARRIAQWHTDEYDTLRPVADLIKDVSEQMRQFLEQPIRWEPSRSDSEEMRQAVVDTIARELHTRLHMLIRIRLITDHQPEWLTAYIRSGRGSAMVRAQDIDGIYRVAAPTFVEMAQVVNIEKLSFGTVHTLEEMLEEEKIDEFTVQVTGILKEAIQLKGGRLIRN